MYCDNCGQKLREGVKFCTKCGKPVSSTNPPPQLPRKPTTPQPPRKPVTPQPPKPPKGGGNSDEGNKNSSGAVKIVIIVAAAVIVLAIAFCAFWFLGGKNLFSNSSKSGDTELAEAFLSGLEEDEETEEEDESDSTEDVTEETVEEETVEEEEFESDGTSTIYIGIAIEDGYVPEPDTISVVFYNLSTDELTYGYLIRENDYETTLTLDYGEYAVWAESDSEDEELSIDIDIAANFVVDEITEELAVNVRGIPEEEESEYIIEGSDSRYITEEDLEDLSADELRLARNELYARHGRKFNDEELQEYFDSKSWYEGTIDPDDFDEDMLNEYETANRDFIVEYEEEQGYR